MKIDLATLRTFDSDRVRQGIESLRKLDRAAIKKRLQMRSVLALTLEAGRMVVAVVRSEGNEGRRVAPLTLPVGAEEVFRNPDKAGKLLAAALETAGIREKRCVVCVPPSWALSASTDLPAVSPDDLRGYLELRAEREFSLPPGEMRLAFCPYDLPGDQRRATLAAITSKRLQSIEQMAVAAGRQAISVSLALNGALSDTDPRLHLHVDGAHADVIVTAGGGVAALRSLPGPTVGEAGEAPVFNSAAFCREVRITLGRLPAPVREEVREAVFGGDEAGVQILRAETGPFLERMGIAVVAEAFSRRAGSAAPAGAATTAAARYLRGEAVPFEFLVPVANRWEGVVRWFAVQRNRRIAMIVIGIILAPILMFFIRSEMESHYAARWNEIHANVDELSILQQKISKFRPWFEPAPQTPYTLKALDALMAGFPDAGDVWAKSIQVGSGYKLSCTGFARNQGALLSTLDRLRNRKDITGLTLVQTRGADPIQFLFTCKWEPNRDR